MQYSTDGIDVNAMRCVAATLDGGVLTITLNRPELANAIDAAMSREMTALLAAIASDDAVRVVVVRGAGDNFCAGLDAPDFFDPDGRDTAELRALREAADEWRIRALRRLPQPVIAMVHGACRGGALAILESCDIVHVAADARFSAVGPLEASLPHGATAKSASAVMTPRAASYFLLTGEEFDGDEAERNGLATRSLPAGELEQATRALADELAAKDAIALRFTKETLRHVGAMTWDGVLSFTAAKFAELKALQAGRPSTRAAAVESFLAGKSKPGLGG
ncbi:MAG TPA: enoyl-CoA hydratase-related protein [Bordetella sp.]|jgi:enoyl-CoA hydratase/carnithine racemase|nr:enoyl-CoA hydratase-related protein [Bordetella sp.]